MKRIGLGFSGLILLLKTLLTKKAKIMTKYYELPVTFSEWRQFARYTLDECRQTFHVSRRTINNWESGKIQPPKAVFLCLMVFSGRLDFLGKKWRGFRITPEAIESPEGDFVRCEEIRAMKYAMQALEINRLRRIPTNINNTPKTIDFNKITFIDKAPKLKQSCLQNQPITRYSKPHKLCEL
jgi:DNA-binding XRE family transcriptional regulator